MNYAHKKRVFDYFAQFITDARREKLQHFAQLRTNYVTIAVEDIYQSHNVSAILRTADCFGVESMHIVEQRNTYKLNEQVAKGSAQWMRINRYNNKEQENIKSCYEKLRSDGYTIIATTPHKNDMLVHQIPLDRKCVLVFGSEQKGLSDYALEHADYYARIPIVGFTESFNVSVSAAICLYDVTQRLRASDIQWQLSPEKQLDLQLNWLGKLTHRTKDIEKMLTQTL